MFSEITFFDFPVFKGIFPHCIFHVNPLYIAGTDTVGDIVGVAVWLSSIVSVAIP
jgi:hypothetical protein